ncbi:hypothetical protein EDD29_5084 [Actinocorallia herbida]|uniref:Uncharacterized protein n=1 Tax=Actinocorallia herbida TaxID=58109 RepID=A0A3N1D1U5_9ACTN|nr:hypothetical protein [Actinocorallia herbida]ROO87476.1 hypothetical protein EDD29_5084 [Actinocorallia herbida]
MEHERPRDAEDDHDLLTFGESGARLREEIALAEGRLAALPAGAERGGLEAHLAALRQALARNTRQAAAQPGESGFLTYTPPPRRTP